MFIKAGWLVIEKLGRQERHPLTQQLLSYQRRLLGRRFIDESWRAEACGQSFPRVSYLIGCRDLTVQLLRFGKAEGVRGFLQPTRLGSRTLLATEHPVYLYDNTVWHNAFAGGSQELYILHNFRTKMYHCTRLYYEIYKGVKSTSKVP